jgi:hypothetical protein
MKCSIKKFEDAEGICAVCKKPFSSEYIQERLPDGVLVCKFCFSENVGKDIGEKIKRDEVVQLEQAKSAESSRAGFPWLRVALALILVGLVAYVAAFPPKFPPRQMPWTVGGPDQWNPGLEKCVKILWGYQEQADVFRYKNDGRQPKSLQDLIALKPELKTKCPVCGQDYVFTALPEGGYVIACPDAKGHSVKSLYASSKMSPPVIVP